MEKQNPLLEVPNTPQSTTAFMLVWIVYMSNVCTTH